MAMGREKNVPKLGAETKTKYTTNKFIHQLAKKNHSLIESVKIFQNPTKLAISGA